MSNYYTYFSVIVPLPDLAAKEYALELARQAENSRGKDEPSTGFPEELLAALEDWWFETEAHDQGIWLQTIEGGVDAVCQFIRHLLRRYHPGGRVMFEWSHDCTKPKLDAYGGGAAIVTAREIKIMTTSGWLAEQAAQHPNPAAIHENHHHPPT